MDIDSIIVSQLTAGLAGNLLALNGVFMLFWPGAWYQTGSGVTATGPLKVTFIIDIALAYLMSGTGLVVGAVQLSRRVALLASVWPVTHAVFHAVLWATCGAPTGAALPTEAFTVLGLATAGGLAAPNLPRPILTPTTH